MKSLTIDLSYVGRCRLPGWNPLDNLSQWVETLNDMAQNRSQWHTCVYSPYLDISSVIISFTFKFYSFLLCFIVVLFLQI
uniref:SJCHGC05208 protein n=1 Tax=Schistosoma japonicum TaxID=6182 RepID=Q5BSA9_SCHJA|nr:SJCHGC05208 protein [Schistosoma japonicum]